MKVNLNYLLSTFKRHSPYTNKGVNGLVLNFTTASAAKMEPGVLFYTLLGSSSEARGGTWSLVQTSYTATFSIYFVVAYMYVPILTLREKKPSVDQLYACNSLMQCNDRGSSYRSISLFSRLGMDHNHPPFVLDTTMLGNHEE